MLLLRDVKLLNVQQINSLKLMEHALPLAQTILSNQLIKPDVNQIHVKVLLSSLEKMVLALLPAQITKRHLPMERNVKLLHHVIKSLLLLEHVSMLAQTSSRILLMLM